MKTKSLVSTALVLLPLLVLGLGTCTACASRQPVDLGLVDGRLRPCPSSPNCVCSEEDEASIAPLAFQGDPDEAFASLVAHVEDLPRTELVEVGDGYAHAVFQSLVFRFADDVEFRLDPEASVIHVRSASRVGHWDFGANRKRVERIRAEWTPPGDGPAD